MTGDGHPHRPAVIIGSAAGSRRRLRSTDGRHALTVSREDEHDR